MEIMNNNGKNLGSVCLKKGAHFVRFTQSHTARTMESFVNKGLTISEAATTSFNTPEEGNNVFKSFIKTGYKRISEVEYESVLYSEYI